MSNIEIFNTITSGVAIVTAIIASIYTYKSYYLSKQALEIGHREFLNKQSNFHLYLIEGFRWNTMSEPKRKILFFHCTLSNKSEISSSFTASLEIEYLRKDDSVARVTVMHDPTLLKDLPQKEISVFDKEIRMVEKSIQSRWVLFEQPQQIFNGYRIEKYGVQFIDVKGRLQQVDSYLVKEFYNETS